MTPKATLPIAHAIDRVGAAEPLARVPVGVDEGRDDVAVLGQLHRRRQQLLPFQPAVAAVQRMEAGDRPWEWLQALEQRPDVAAAFREWITDLRRERRLRDDDVTLLSISL